MKKCPNCGKMVTKEMIEANMCWECGFILDESLADNAQDIVDAQREEIKKKEYANSIGDAVEYEVETVVTNSDGFTDVEEMNRIFSERAAHGWKLHTVYANTLGVNAIKVLGIGANSTVSETVMVFERCIRRE